MNKKLISFASALLLSFLLVLTGCTNPSPSPSENDQATSQGESIADTGTLYLKVNPELAIDYDESGLVTEVRGMNPEGEDILMNYTDFVGKRSGQVLEELIGLMGEAGYFIEEVAGESKSIVIELEAGSVLPGNNFLEQMATNAQRAVENYKESATQTSEEAPIESVEQPSDTKVSYENNTLLSMDEAKRIAFEHAGVDSESVRMDDQDLEIEDGVPVYELEFEVGPDEYEYEIHGLTGEVIQFDQDIESSSEETSPTERISLDDAKQIAFEHARVDGSQARFDDQEFDTDDGIPYYSLEFEIGEADYEYEIHAETGEILDFDHDLD